MAARKINYFLDSTSSLRRLADAARHISELQRIVLKLIPPQLAPGCLVRQLKAGVLIVSAENAATATKLKQITSRLLTSCQEQGLQVTSIRVEVQVKEALGRPPRSLARTPLSVETIENLENLAAALEDSPLKRAVARLAARQRARR